MEENSCAARVVLLPHEHTLFCERKQRVCSSVGQMQELEILEITDLPEHVKSWIWVRTRIHPNSIPDASASVQQLDSDESSIQWEAIEGSEAQQKYQLQLADVGHHISVRFESSISNKITSTSTSTSASDNKAVAVPPGSDSKVEVALESAATATTATAAAAAATTTTTTTAVTTTASPAISEEEEEKSAAAVDKLSDAMENSNLSVSNVQVEDNESSEEVISATAAVKEDATSNATAATGSETAKDDNSTISAAASAAAAVLSSAGEDVESSTTADIDSSAASVVPAIPGAASSTADSNDVPVPSLPNTTSDNIETVGCLESAAAKSTDQNKAEEVDNAISTAANNNDNNTSSSSTTAEKAAEAAAVSVAGAVPPSHSDTSSRSSRSEFVVAASLGPVLPGPPRLVNFEVTGDLVPGDIAVADTHYIGGVEGESEYWWLKVDAEGRRTTISEAVPCATEQVTKFKRIIAARESGTDLSIEDLENLAVISKVYVIKEEDLGCVLKVKCRPVRSDGHKGEIFTSRPSLRVIAKGTERPPEEDDDSD